jgi:hypothetical protein
MLTALLLRSWFPKYLQCLPGEMPSGQVLDASTGTAIKTFCTEVHKPPSHQQNACLTSLLVPAAILPTELPPG